MDLVPESDLDIYLELNFELGLVSELDSVLEWELDLDLDLTLFLTTPSHEWFAFPPVVLRGLWFSHFNWYGQARLAHRYAYHLQTEVSIKLANFFVVEIAYDLCFILTPNHRYDEILSIVEKGISPSSIRFEQAVLHR